MDNLHAELRQRLKEEHKAARDYNKNAKQFRSAGLKASSRLLAHIRDEERHHAAELVEERKSVPLSKLRRARHG